MICDKKGGNKEELEEPVRAEGSPKGELEAFEQIMKFVFVWFDTMLRITHHERILKILRDV